MEYKKEKQKINSKRNHFFKIINRCMWAKKKVQQKCKQTPRERKKREKKKKRYSC